jgi:arabinan endo-1,5-alpha-L-arabinosidase
VKYGTMFTLTACLVLGGQAAAQQAPRAHDPSTLVREGDSWWFFHTGQGIRASFSRDLREWRETGPVLNPPPPWTKELVPGYRGHTWAPDLIRRDGRWWLYYSVSTFGKNTSAIGLASNPTLDPRSSDYRWADHGPVLRSQAADDFNAIDPALFRDQDGSLWLVFGSYWTGIKLTELDPKTGLRKPDSPLRPLAWKEAIEAACLARHGDHYYLFVNWGQCCRGVDSTYRIMVGRSRKLSGPYLDREGRDLLGGGGSLFLGTEGQRIGPGHASLFQDGGKEWFAYHYYDAADRGRSKLALRRLDWQAGWPRPAP